MQTATDSKRFMISCDLFIHNQFTWNCDLDPTQLQTDNTLIAFLTNLNCTEECYYL